MLTVTITVPLSAIPGVKVEYDFEHDYMSPKIVSVPLERLALQFEGEVPEHYPAMDTDDYAGDWDTVWIGEGFHKLSKPRLVVT